MIKSLNSNNVSANYINIYIRFECKEFSSFSCSTFEVLILVFQYIYRERDFDFILICHV